VIQLELDILCTGEGMDQGECTLIARFITALGKCRTQILLTGQSTELIDQEIDRLLEEISVAPNQIGEEQMTPLMLTAYYANDRATKKLLEMSNISINQKNVINEEALDYAYGPTSLSMNEHEEGQIKVHRRRTVGALLAYLAKNCPRTRRFRLTSSLSYSTKQMEEIYREVPGTRQEPTSPADAKQILQRLAHSELTPSNYPPPKRPDNSSSLLKPSSSSIQ
jgi:hypothetical protein